MARKEIPKNIDLLIVDIDDIFIYHRTVAVANRIFLRTVAGLVGADIKEKRLLTTADAIVQTLKVFFFNIHGFRFRKKALKKLVLLCSYAVLLHSLNIAKEIYNFLGGKMSDEMVIRVWADAVKRLRLNAEEYFIGRETLKKSLYDETMEVLDSIRKANKKMSVAAVSENFSLSAKKDPIIPLLGIDIMECNTFICDKKGRIKDYDIKIADSSDKKRIAESIISRKKAKNIGIMVDDYDDLGLLEIKNLKLVVYSQKIERFIDKKNYCTIKVNI